MPKKYFITSDLHLEFRQGKEIEFWKAFPYRTIDKPTVCICAGDLTTFRLPEAIYTAHFARLCERFDKVIYVPGNHEYYGSHVDEIRPKIAVLEYILAPTLTVLRSGEPYTFDGQRFIGDTMWFIDQPGVHIYRRQISDSFQIKGLFPWCFTESHLFMLYLQNEVKEDDIVVTHHIPNDVDTNIMWKGSTTQFYFVNDDCHRYWMNPNTIKPKAWIYGHTHDKHDYHIGRTHFICNPVGYPGENSFLPEAAEPAVYEI